MASLKFSIFLIIISTIGNADLYNKMIGISSNSKYRITNFDLSGIQIWATAPEGNLTQGEVTFQKVNDELQFSSGFGVDVLSSLQISLGFTVKVIPTKGWATQYSNGSWFGMAKEILDGEADISIAKTSILPNRAKEFAYLAPTHGLGLYAFFVQPSSNSGRNIFLDPFERNLWICVISTYLILIGSVKLLSILAKFSKQLSTSDSIMAEDVGIWAFYTISQHGYGSVPKLTCLRISLLSGVVFGLVIYVSYAATLVSMFSIESMPIKSIKDLFRSQIRITIDSNNQAAKNLIQAHDTGSSNFHLSTAAQGGKSVLKGRSAFLTFKDTFYTTTKNTLGAGDSEFCGKITAIPVTDAKFRSGLFVSKGSPLREPFNIKIIAMYNNGIMQRFVKNYEDTYTPTCDPQLGHLRETPSIDLPDVIAAFYGIVVGFCIAFAIYSVEFACFRYFRKRERSIHDILDVGDVVDEIQGKFNNY